MGGVLICVNNERVKKYFNTGFVQQDLDMCVCARARVCVCERERERERERQREREREYITFCLSVSLLHARTHILH